MRVTPCSVHDECSGIFADSLREGLRSFLNDDVPPTTFIRERSVERGSIRIITILECGNDNVILEARFTLQKVMR